MTISREEYERRILAICETKGYDFLGFAGEWKGAKTRVALRCLHDGHEWDVRIANLQQGKGCPKCSTSSKRLSQCEVIKRLEALSGITFIGFVGGEHVNHNTRCSVSCDTCYHKWSPSYDNLVNHGTGCPKCAGKYTPTTEEAIKRINNLPNVKLNFFITGKFIGGKTHCNVTHTECGHTWETRYNNLVNYGTGCPKCAKTGYNPDKSGTLYFLRSTTRDIVKIGITNKPEQRIKQLTRGTPFEFNVIAQVTSEDGAYIASLERVAHDLFPSANLTGFDGATEWREINHDKLNFFIEVLNK